MTVRRLLRIARQRWRSLAGRDRLDAEVDRELTFHLEALSRELMDAGLSADEARQKARRLLGNPVALAEQCRDQRRLGWLDDLRQDAAYGMRILRRDRGLTIVAVFSFALGIGATGAAFGLVRTALLEPLPFPAADRLVRLTSIPPPGVQGLRGAAASDVAAWRSRSDLFDLTGVSFANSSNFGDDGDRAYGEHIAGLLVTPDWFRVLGMAPQLGRTFDEADADAGIRNRVLVISDGLWHRRYGADPSIVGAAVRIDGASQTIIGVMPAGFRTYGGRVEYWRPMRTPDASRPDGPGRPYQVIARLRPGITIAQAGLVLDALVAGRARAQPERHAGWRVRVESLREALYGWARRPLLTLQAAVALVLIVACVNVAGLLLARGIARRRELVMRASLGASRARVVRQLLTEGLLLSAAGGLAGLVVARLGLVLFRAVVDPQPGTPPLDDTGLSWPLVLTMAGLAIASGVACSLAPALTTGRLDLMTALKRSSLEGGIGTRDHRQRSWLVTAQIAVALVLLTSSGLLLNSFVRLSGRDLNFDPDRLLAFTYGVPTLAFVRPVASDPEDPRFALDRAPLEVLPRLLEGLGGLPGVTGVAASSFRPVDSLIRPRVVVRRANGGSDADDGHDVVHFLVTPGFFAIVGTPLLRGQEFGPQHRTPVAVVNEAAARRLSPDGSPVGSFVELHSEPGSSSRQVIGVVANIPTRHGEVDPEPIIYTPYRQLPPIHRGRFVSMYAGLTVWLRTADDPFALVGSVRQVARDLNPDRPPGAFNTVERQLRAGLRGFDTYVAVLAGFAVTATLLAAVGVYGVLAYAVSQRAREIGVRMTLGAGRREIVQVVARQAGPVILLGLVAGVLGSLIVARLVAAELWGVTPTDVLTYLASAALVLLAAVTACLVPARRALAVDPNVALRSE